MRQFLFKDQILTSPENGLLRLFYADKSTQYHGGKTTKIQFDCLRNQSLRSKFSKFQSSGSNWTEVSKKAKCHSPPTRGDAVHVLTSLAASKNQPHKNDMEDTMLEKKSIWSSKWPSIRKCEWLISYNTPYFLVSFASL